MEEGKRRKRAREEVSFPLTAPEILLAMSKMFNSVTLVVGGGICFCSEFVEDPYGMPTTTACPV